jgi:hypothetical protein
MKSANFDANYCKYIRISFENEQLKSFGNLFKFQYIFVSFTIIRLLLQNFLTNNNNNETELLMLFADRPLCGQKVIQLLKLLNIYNSSIVFLLFFSIWITNLFESYFFSNLFFLIEDIIIGNFGSFIIFRFLSIYYIIYKLIIIAFNEVNQDFESH